MRHRCVVFFFVLSLCPRVSSAGIVHSFDLRSPVGVSEDEPTLTFLATGLEDAGVMFDAYLTVTATDGRSAADAVNGVPGNPANVHQGPFGLGADVSSFDTLTSNESLLFTLTTSNVSGGQVSINGFASIFLTGLASPERAQFFLVEGTPTAPATPALTLTSGIGILNALGTTESFRLFADTTSSTFPANFYVRSLTANFEATAVPEPSTFSFVLLSSAILIYKRRRQESR